MKFFEALQHTILNSISKATLYISGKWNSLLEDALNDPTVNKVMPKAYTASMTEVLNETLKPAYTEHARVHIQHTGYLNDHLKGGK